MPEKTEPTPRLLDFESVYTGEAVNDGRMDVRDLAPSILATSILVEQVSALINGPERPVLTQYKTAKDGSFAVQLLLEAAWPQNETAIFELSDIEVLKRVLGVLWGGVAGSELAGLFQLIRFLKGQQIGKLETNGFPVGVIAVYNAYGESIITSTAAMSMAMNPKARSEAYKVVKPLEKPGIDSFYIILDKQLQGEPITKEDVAYFLPEQEESPPEEVEEIVQLVKADVSNSKAKWRFLSINSGRFSALISDPEFIQRFESGTIRVGHNDSLRVKMLKRTIAWGGRTRLDYEVIRVIAYYPGGTANSQLLFPPSE